MDPCWNDLDATAEAARPPPVFASPFDELGPGPLARYAAGVLQTGLRCGTIADGIPASILDEPGGGKMFGVLVVCAPDGRLGFLKAFSGTLGGRFDVPGFAPPLFDREARAAVEVEGERTVKSLTARAEAFAALPSVVQVRAALEELAARHRGELAALRAAHTEHRQQRRSQREALEAAGPPAADETLHDLAQQSRRDKAERRRLDATQAAEWTELAARFASLDRRAAAHVRLHRMVSRYLMRQIHDTYRIANARGEVRPLRSLYAPAEPPGGAGDCAAPKLLAYAYAKGLRPVALAEFWWGAPPLGGGRVAGAFYPACRDKCGPLLPFMLEGLDVAAPRLFTRPESAGLELRVVFEDDCIVVVDKPCGLLSVPPRSGGAGDSVLERLRSRYPGATGPLLVHRLDLDTSGLLVAALNETSHAALQRQFLRRSVEKRYVALVNGDVGGDEGTIDLAIRVDVADRPRQIHDPVHGRSAVTAWKVLERGTATRIAFFPRSGRTHQLRVHAAHPLGLGAAIIGDRLYGLAGDRLYGRAGDRIDGREGGRLMLHAESLAFTHPVSGQRVVFVSSAPF